MFEIRVDAEFAAAHFLKDYHGKCENLHGHNYKVYAHVKGSELNEGGMLLDFSILKASLKSVCKTLDHINLNDIAYFQQNPSAERIAKYIFENLKKLLEQSDVSNNTDTAKLLYCVDVFETEHNRARYLAE